MKDQTNIPTPPASVVLPTLDPRPSTLGLDQPSSIQHPASGLKHFTQPAILRQIGIRRLEKFLDAFRGDVKAANISLPIPPDQDHSTHDEQPPAAPSTNSI